jgi:hypothetical protein
MYVTCHCIEMLKWTGLEVGKLTSLSHCHTGICMSAHHVINQMWLFIWGLVNHMWVPLKWECEDELGRKGITQHTLKKTAVLSWMFLLLEIWYVKVKKWQVVFGWYCDYVFSGKQSLPLRNYVKVHTHMHSGVIGRNVCIFVWTSSIAVHVQFRRQEEIGLTRHKFMYVILSQNVSDKCVVTLQIYV